MMDPAIRNFIVKILIAAVIMVLLAIAVFTLLIPEQYLPVLPWMLSLFTAIAILTYAWQVKLLKKALGVFTRNSMIISMVRLMVYSIFAIAYLAVNQNNPVVFVVSLLVVYAIYTMLEVRDLARLVRKK